MAKLLNELHLNLQGIDLEEVTTFLEGAEYPATKRELLDVAYDNGAPDHILEFLNLMPDQEYYSFTELMLTLEDVREQ